MVAVQMKNLLRSIFIAAGFLFVTTAASAQKWAYVNTQYIPRTSRNTSRFSNSSTTWSVQWQKEIEDKYAIIDKLLQSLQAEQVLLTEEMKKRRRTRSCKGERCKDLQKQRFGFEGDLFKKKQELVNPSGQDLQRHQEPVNDQSIMAIFDKSGDLTILYANAKYDKSDDVLLALGYSPAKKDAPAKSAAAAPFPPGGDKAPRRNKNLQEIIHSKPHPNNETKTYSFRPSC